jgi:putative restriction endonuclease
MRTILDQLYCLKRDKVGDYERPHKPALLLSVLDMFDRGELKENRVTFTESLKNRFNEIFEIVKKEDSKATIQNPFFYMSGEDFWSTKDSGGNELYIPGNVGRAPSMKILREGYAEMSSELFQAFSDDQQRDGIRESLISRYFSKEAKDLKSALAYSTDVVVTDTTPARSAAFAKVVKGVYDYRCAACGERVKVGTVHFVDAAHLMPFSVSYNDHPSNGMALCKNHHWAMDHKLIAPHPDNYWVISEKLDNRINDHMPLIDLNKRSIIAPLDKRFEMDPKARTAV